MKKQWKGFLCGLLTAGLLASTVTPALGALAAKTIQVYTGVNVYVDDVKIEPKDANGNPVEVFVYNGTTYLPIRAIGNALGKTVQWDGKTNSAYVGKHSGDKPAVWLKDLDYYARNSSFQFYDTEKDSLGNQRTHVITRSIGDDEGLWYRYRINGQYTAISGVLFHPYRARDYRRATTLNIYGDGELLYTATVQGGSDPIDPVDFYVDISGVLELEIELAGYYIDTGMRWATPGCVADCGLWT